LYVCASVSGVRHIFVTVSVDGRTIVSYNAALLQRLIIYE
jgi:hypothetical protein